MSRTFPELETVRVEVSDVTRERHLSAIEATLRSTRLPRGRRFRLMAVAVAIVLLLPVIALAAERAGPGDLLYPVRQVMQSLTDAAGGPSSDGSPSDVRGRASTIAPGSSTPVTDRPAPTEREVTPDDSTQLRDGETDGTSGDENLGRTQTPSSQGDRRSDASTNPDREASDRGDTGDDDRTAPDRP